MATELKPLTDAPARAPMRRGGKKALTAAAFRARAQAHALEALEALVWLAENATSESVRVSAANAVLDRAHGKPMAGARAAEEEDDAGGENSVLKVRWLDPARS
jgi:hypothetical protein